MNQIQLPAGFRDSILDECRKKNELKQTLNAVFESYGYEEIQTPVLEFYQTYSKAFSNLNDQDMYKFFDQEQDILTLRIDMTVPIARAVTTRFKDEMGPFRLRYCANVYKVRPSLSGKRSEVMDCGVELIGLDHHADLEVLACALEALNALNLPNFMLEIGTVQFFECACQIADLNETARQTLADLIDRKSLVELKEYLDTLPITNQIRTFFLNLPLLGGEKDVLEKALSLSFAPELESVVLQMKQLDAQLTKLGYGGLYQFDFGKIPHLDYYTGIIFEGFVEGVGNSVLSGGRYDKLLQVFGNDLPACGFSFKLDTLAETISIPTKKANIQVLYPQAQIVEALKIAQQLRQKGNVELRLANVETIYIKEEE